MKINYKYNYYIFAFTLVELIVVITILTVLSTIAFISFRWYNSNTRDSVRISDLSNVVTSMELYELEAWKYPNPLNWKNVTYSWVTIWNQWSLGESVYTNLSKLDKIPKDPLLDKEYTYSISQNATEYEISWIVEGDEDKVKAIIVGNYNGIVSKVKNGNECYYLTLPSLITSDLDYSTDYIDLHDSWWLVYNWFNNLPATFKNSKFYLYWWFDFFSETILAYSDNNYCELMYSTTSSWNIEKVKLLKWVQNSYSWTLLVWDWEISNISDLYIDINSPTKDIIDYSINFLNLLKK